MLTPDQKRERIEIRVPKNYAQTDESIWEDLEECLFHGFLSSHALVQGQSFVFKTLNQLEVRAIDFMRPARSSSDEAKVHFRAAFIAHSIFMVNGTNALWERPRHINRLIKTVSKLPASVQDHIVEQLAKLNERASRAYPLTEVYVYENRARFKWMQYRDVPLNSPAVTGIPGTELVGLNTFQLTWSALSRIQDRRDEVEKDWAHAKFIGSCFAGKGIRSIDERDKMRLERDRVNREERKMKVLRAYLNRTVGSSRHVETVILPDGRSAEVVGRFRADSAEELAVQLAAALNNEKDAHDLAVEEHFRRFRDRAQEVESERIRLLNAPRQVFRAEIGSHVIEGGKAEADARVARMRAAALESVRRITPDSETSDTQDD